jgi:outer membrane protein
MTRVFVKRRLATAALAVLLAAMPLWPASSPLPEWLRKRFYPDTVQVRDVQGIAEHVVDGKLRLTVKDFMELVLKNSTDVNLTRLDVYNAADQITAAEAAFDPTLSLGYNTFRSVAPQSSQLAGASTLSNLTQNSFLNYQQVLPGGQTASAGFNAAKNSTNSTFNFLNPNIQSSMNFSVTQSLLQNRTNIQRRAPIEIARTQLLITTEQSEGRIQDTLAAAAGQYWDAVRARDNIGVLAQTLDLAQKSYERDKKALDLGALSELDIFQSQSQVAARNRDLISAQYAYRSSLDGLRRLIGADLTPQLRAMEIELGDDPAMLPSKSAILPFEDSLTAALRVRPELSAAHRRVTVDDLNARMARNLLLPRVDLTAQGSASGIGGNLLGPPLVPGGLADALSQTLGFNFPGYGAGVQISLPLHSKAAQAQLADSLVNKTRDQYTERQLQQQITQDVRLALNSLELANATIEAAILARDLAQKNVDAEQQKYELGSVTAFEVLDSQNNLASAQSAVLNAYVGYQQAFVNYQRSTAALLEGLGAVIDTPKVK